MGCDLLDFHLDTTRGIGQPLRLFLCFPRIHTSASIGRRLAARSTTQSCFGCAAVQYSSSDLPSVVCSSEDIPPPGRSRRSLLSMFLDARPIDSWGLSIEHVNRVIFRRTLRSLRCSTAASRKWIYWRRGWDSNTRSDCSNAGFQDAPVARQHNALARKRHNSRYNQAALKPAIPTFWTCIAT